MRCTQGMLNLWRSIMKYKCLSIGGFDGSGGAGIQADLKTFSALGCYGMTVLTALPVQNTCGVRHCYHLPLPCIEEQMQAIFEDITPNAIKIGMLFSAEIIEIVACFLDAHAKGIPIVLDPVMVAKSGHALLHPDSIDALKVLLIPQSTLITPNILEAHTLIGIQEDQEAQARALRELRPNAVLVKGGHLEGAQSNDLLMDHEGKTTWLRGTRIASKNTHGTGCTLSAAICAYVARGHLLVDACQRAKKYVHGAIKAAEHASVGKGHGPVHHFYALWPD